MDGNGKYKIILSGGGTGGHIYPAVAVAQQLTARLGPEADILFVGAEGRMEMEKLPALGYTVRGLPVAGLQRKLAAGNFALPFKIAKSVRMARRVLKDFGAQIAVGFGGYASGPVLWSAQRMGIPTILQEQNSYAGLTNKILARGARKICVAYDGMERFFPADRIVMTGNPLRAGFSAEAPRQEALEYFGLQAGKPVVLILGGSLGTRTLNEMMKSWIDRIVADSRMQVIWQTGKYYSDEIGEFMKNRTAEGIWHGPFIERMDLAYAAADIVVSRSGANTVSELCLVGKPVIFVPSPNVAEDHQTRNARALAEIGAAQLVADSEASEKVIPMVEAILSDTEKMAGLTQNIRSLAKPDAARQIADLIIETIDKERKK